MQFVFTILLKFVIKNQQCENLKIHLKFVKIKNTILPVSLPSNHHPSNTSLSPSVAAFASSLQCLGCLYFFYINIIYKLFQTFNRVSPPVLLVLAHCFFFRPFLQSTFHFCPWEEKCEKLWSAREGCILIRNFCTLPCCPCRCLLPCQRIQQLCWQTGSIRFTKLRLVKLKRQTNWRKATSYLTWVTYKHTLLCSFLD